MRLLPPEYKATAIVFLGGSEANLIASESAWSAVNAPVRDRTEEARTVSAVLTSLPVLRRVVMDLDLYKHPEKFEPRASVLLDRLEASLPEPVVDFGLSLLDPASASTDKPNMVHAAAVAEAKRLSANGAPTLVDATPDRRNAEGAMQPAEFALATNDLEDEDEDIVRGTVAALAEKLEVEIDMRSKLGFITFAGSDPDLVADIVNKVPAAYTTESAHRMAEGTANAIAWLETRVESVRQDVLNSERKVELYKAENGAVDGLDGDARSREINRMVEEAEAAQRELIDVRDRLLRARDQIESDRADADLFDSELIKNLIAARAEAESRRREFLVRVSPDHSVVRQLDDKIAGLNQDIAAEKEGIVASFEEEVGRGERKLERARDRLRKAQAELATSAGEAAQTSVSVDDLEREAEANRTLHTSLLARLKQVRQLSELQTSAIQMVQPALPPQSPSGFGPNLIVAAVGFGSLCLGFAFVGGLALLDRRIVDADQLTPFGFDAMVIAPFVRDIDRMHDEKPRPGQKDAHARILFGEAIRRTLVGTLYDPGAEEDRARLAMVTSGSKGEGKTSVAYAMARAAAMAKIPTVLVEADLRRPGRLARQIGHANEGLAGHLENGTPLGEIEYREDDSGLTIMPTTRTVQHSTELLASPQMHKLLRELSQRFTFVVIDTAPVCLTPDPEVLAPYVHHIVFVIRHKQSTFARTGRALDLLRRASEAPLIGFVNTTDDRFPDTYYGAGEHTYLATPLKTSRWRGIAARMRRGREPVPHSLSAHVPEARLARKGG